jgi:hypothetical protein
VPNSARLLGGAGTDSAPVGYEDDQQRSGVSTVYNSVVVCTGANACGKVNLTEIYLYSALILPAECLFETGTWIRL